MRADLLVVRKIRVIVGELGLVCGVWVADDIVVVLVFHHYDDEIIEWGIGGNRRLDWHLRRGLRREKDDSCDQSADQDNRDYA
jgi:hypothetical protein